MTGLEVILVAHHARAERDKARRREEEECMTGYSPQDLGGNWQFKIVRGTFKTKVQIDKVVHEQAEFGWQLVEIFDQNRIRFKRPQTEAGQDDYREGNPYATVSQASAPGCGATFLVLLMAVGVGWWFWS